MRYAILTGILILLGATLVYFSMDRISPFDKTVSTMLELRHRILLYANTHNELPSDLNSLPYREGYTNTVIDGWGHPIIYHCDKQQGIVTLTSFGKAGKADCDESQSCLTRKYEFALENGRWIVR